METKLKMFSVLILLIASFLDYKKQGFERKEFIVLLIGFFLVGLVWGFYIINFIVVLVITLMLILKIIPIGYKRGKTLRTSILNEGDLIIPAFALVNPLPTLFLVLAIPLAMFITMFYKHYTKKTSTGFIPYYLFAVIILTLINLI